MVPTGTLVTMVGTETLVSLVTVSGNLASNGNHKTVKKPSMVAMETMVTTGQLEAW
jgi:hypothetical protein